MPLPTHETIVGNLAAVRQSEGATLNRIGDHCKDVMTLPVVANQMALRDLQGSDGDRRAATRSVLECAVDSKGIGTTARLILRFALNFVGSPFKLDQRRGLAMNKLNISRNTFEKRENDAFDLLAAFLLNVQDSPCDETNSQMTVEEIERTIQAMVERGDLKIAVGLMSVESRPDRREAYARTILSHVPRGDAESRHYFPNLRDDNRALVLLRESYADFAQSAMALTPELYLDVSEFSFEGTDNKQLAEWWAWDRRALSSYVDGGHFDMASAGGAYGSARSRTISAMAEELLRNERKDTSDGGRWEFLIGRPPVGSRVLPVY